VDAYQDAHAFSFTDQDIYKHTYQVCDAFAQPECQRHLDRFAKLYSFAYQDGYAASYKHKHTAAKRDKHVYQDIYGHQYAVFQPDEYEFTDIYQDGNTFKVSHSKRYGFVYAYRNRDIYQHEDADFYKDQHHDLDYQRNLHAFAYDNRDMDRDSAYIYKHADYNQDIYWYAY
jgi:hypothetical protein